jgi:3',5'-nucleoside bisphosphate phosphatase
VARARQAAVAITDHDTLSALAVARPEAAFWGVELVAGVEWTAGFGGREIHVLGHFLDDDPGVVAVCARLRAARAERFSALAERLDGLGLSVDIGALLRLFPRAALGRRHLAEWLVCTRQVSSTREAFARYLGDTSPAVVPGLRLDWEEAIALTAAAGGVAALAHPPYNLHEAELKTLADGGLGAIEVDGPAVSARLGRRWCDWADRFDLVPIAGSDFHALDRPGRWVGAVVTPDATLERLRERARSSGSQPLGDERKTARSTHETSAGGVLANVPRLGLHCVRDEHLDAVAAHERRHPGGSLRSGRDPDRRGAEPTVISPAPRPSSGARRSGAARGRR